MQFQRPGDQRGRTRADGRDSQHAFSFGDAVDPAWTGFGALRVCNEDRLAPAAIMPPQRRANMELLTVVLDGALRHDDVIAGAMTLPAGAVHLLGAGHGLEHAMSNASANASAQMLQLWLQPARVNLPPLSVAMSFPASQVETHWAVLASPDGVDGGLPLRLQAWLRRSRAARGAVVTFARYPAQDYWLQVLGGEVEIDGQPYRAGDALGWRDEAGTCRIVASGDGDADLLLLTLPR